MPKRADICATLPSSSAPCSIRRSARPTTAAVPTHAGEPGAASSVTLPDDQYSRATVYYLAQPDGGDFSVSAAHDESEDEKIIDVQTSGDEKKPAFAEFAREHQTLSFMEYAEYPDVTGVEVVKAVKVKTALF